MALTKKQAKAVINLFVSSFTNSNNEKERKKLFIDFEDIFGRVIADWHEICREKIEQTENKGIVEHFDRLASRKEENSNEIYIVRELQLTDLEQVRELINRAFALGITQYDNDKLEKFIKSGYSVVAYNEEDIVGVTLAYEMPDLNTKSIYVDTFTVCENVRGKGIGSKMLSYIESKAFSKEIGVMRLKTNKKIDAYQIYKHWGFDEDEMVLMKKYVLKWIG